MTHSNRAVIRARAALVAAVIAAALLAGCTPQADSLANDYSTGDNGGDYISGDGTTVVISAAKRDDPITFGGTTDTGSTVSSTDFVGKVVLVNFWYAACGPCRTEAADLEKLYKQYGDAGVAFVGVNLRDSAAQARTFAQKFGVGYSSILDADKNDVTLAFAGSVPPNAVPTTLLLDTKGRVAARFSGAIQSPSVVSAVLDDLVAEK